MPSRSARKLFSFAIGEVLAVDGRGAKHFDLFVKYGASSAGHSVSNVERGENGCPCHFLNTLHNFPPLLLLHPIPPYFILHHPTLPYVSILFTLIVYPQWSTCAGATNGKQGDRLECVMSMPI